MGTETSPELVDAAGDVKYDQRYLGPKSLAYLDVLSGWIDYDNSTDRVAFHLKTGENRALERRSAENMYGCTLHGIIRLDGAIVGNLTVSWTKRNGGTGIASFATVREPDDFYGGKTIHHGFAAAFDEPGLYTWSLNRSDVLLHADTIEALAGGCVESGSPSQTFFELYRNSDQAESKSAFSFRELRRIAGPDGAKDPVEAYQPPTTATTEPVADTAAAGFVLVAAAFAVAMARRKNL
ncbi:MAG: hypothetical protein HYT80_08120 [Euryarchaeota archaeon]|nr:hypothetical protein [Euryarchaeota archaeon]